MEIDELKQELRYRMEGSLMLNIAFIGIYNGLFIALDGLGEATPSELALASRVDPGYCGRWCDAAFSCDYIAEAAPGVFKLTDQGRGMLSDELMPFAVQSILSAHLSSRVAEAMRSGERPGESVLSEVSTVAPWFGKMLEQQFGPFFEQQILPNVHDFAEADAACGLAVDLGCGNGWYLRRLAQRYPNLRAVGLDALEANVCAANEAAKSEGLDERVIFQLGDIYNFSIAEQADLIAMNRALHHVWDEIDSVARILYSHLRTDGVLVVWEPNWPRQRATLREAGYRTMAFQNLNEHLQGNHYLGADEIAERLDAAGFTTRIHLFAYGREAVITAKKT